MSWGKKWKMITIALSITIVVAIMVLLRSDKLTRLNAEQRRAGSLAIEEKMENENKNRMHLK